MKTAPNTTQYPEFHALNPETGKAWATQHGEYQILVRGDKTGPDPVSVLVYREIAPEFDKRLEMLKNYLREFIRFEKEWEARKTIWIVRNAENPEHAEVSIVFINWEDIYGEWTITLGGPDGGLNPERLLRVHL